MLSKYGIKYHFKSPPPAGIFFTPTPRVPSLSIDHSQTANKAQSITLQDTWAALDALQHRLERIYVAVRCFIKQKTRFLTEAGSLNLYTVKKSL